MQTEVYGYGSAAHSGEDLKDTVANYMFQEFSDRVDYIGSQFRSDVSFRQCHFFSTVSFQHVYFHTKASFSESTFESASIFAEARSNGVLSFSQCVFKDSCLFWWAHFENSYPWVYSANFDNVRFEELADFYAATFDNSAYFGDANFYDRADFSYATFDKRLDFRRAQFYESALFVGMTLPDTLDLRAVRVYGAPLDFRSCTKPLSGSKCQVALQGSDVAKILINSENFELLFHDKRVGAFRGQSDTVDTTFEERLSIFNSILSQYKRDGLEKSHKILDLEKRAFVYPTLSSFDKFTDRVDSIWWNYGYDRWLIFLWTIGLLLMCFVVNLFFYGKLSEELYEMKFLTNSRYKHYGFRTKAFFYPLNTAIYTITIFFGLRFDMSKLYAGSATTHPRLLLLLLFDYVVGLVCVGFLVNYVLS